MLLIARTARHAYLVRYSDLLEMRMADDGQAVTDSHGRPCETVQLGPLLDGTDWSELRRPRALLVQLRRRVVALLVEAVESLEASAAAEPLPELLRARLGQPWVIGALAHEDEVLLLLDLRAIAMGYLIQQRRAEAP